MQRLITTMERFLIGVAFIASTGESVSEYLVNICQTSKCDIDINILLGGEFFPLLNYHLNILAVGEHFKLKFNSGV